MARDIVIPGVHAQTFSGKGAFAQIEMQAQQASLESGARQAQLLVLQEILKELQKNGQLSTKMEQHAATTRYGFGF